MFYRFALIGHPVSHSLSPLLHQAALHYYDLQGDYSLIDLTSYELSTGIKKIISDQYSGFNVTLPHKQAVLQMVDELTPEASMAAAINTVKVDLQGKLIGHNTDLGGFMVTLADCQLPRTRKLMACVIGNGGAARAAILGLSLLNFSGIQIIARSVEKAKNLVLDLQANLADSKSVNELPKIDIVSINLNDLKEMPDLLVNATPIGLVDEPIADWLQQLLRWTNPEGVVLDMVYGRNGKTTELIKLARKLRLYGIDGREMLIQQAALSFEFWMGKPGPIDAMRQALEHA